MRRKLARGTAAAAGLATILLAGCSTTPTVTFGAAHPVGGPIHADTTSGKELSGSQWPKACSLLSDAELTAILPQATDITRRPKPLHLYSIPDFTHADAPMPNDEDVPEAGCDIGFTLPAKYDGANSSLSITMLGIGDRSMMSELYDKDKASDSKVSHGSDLGAVWGADACYDSEISAGSEPSVHCRAGVFYFEVSGNSSATAFTGKDAHDASGNQTFQDKVISQTVTTLTARMS